MHSKYLIISGTNRKGSKSSQMASLYQQLLLQANVESKVLSLENLPIETFNINSKSELLKQLENELIIPSQKIIFIAPEYNGSFPGALKLLLDCCDIKNSFWHKKAALVGLSDGRNGNLIGLDHLTGVLNYLKINVLHYKVNIPFVSKSIQDDGSLIDEQLRQTLMKQIDEFIKF